MNLGLRRNLPLIFLACISLFWGAYYSTNTWLNEFGEENREWFFLVDGLVVLPILCLICIKDKKQALIKAIVYTCIAILIGSYIIPEESKSLWLYLEAVRFVVLACFILLEIMAIITMVTAIRVAINEREDPDIAIEASVERYVGRGILSTILSFETRLWMFVFCSKSIAFKQYLGDRHFSYHLKDGAQSTALGFIFIILLELPIVHLIVHFAWSSIAANIISFLSVLGLLFLVADCRSMSRRPISITSDKLIIRYGILSSKEIPLGDIRYVEKSSGHIRRQNKIKRYNHSGNPNVVVGL
ncbi:hypothetical protein [Microbulbifer sp. GL-2]|uniref:hypothetical protein n=1 Tax=Microbulbifer sp. GL-2 TaxID=2591606 RepID=UPI00117CCEA3|nr:hypothetical protein [Microbulbifer sp. GL-2]